MKHDLILNDRYIERQQPALGKEYHQICTCGWQGPWTDRDAAKAQRCGIKSIGVVPRLPV